MVAGCTQKSRHNDVVLQLARSNGVERGGGCRAVLDELFQQCLVEIRKVFEQLGPCFGFAFAVRWRNCDERRRRALTVSPGAFGNQIDNADHSVAVADRDLAQYDQMVRAGLQRRRDIPDPAAGGVDLVDENEARGS